MGAKPAPKIHCGRSPIPEGAWEEEGGGRRQPQKPQKEKHKLRKGVTLKMGQKIQLK